jgi:glycosyltransferase involved in cell wall biosynthesis
VYSETTRDKVATLFGIEKSKIWVIADVPYHHFYPNQISRIAARQHFQISATGFVYLFFGMIKPYKGVEDLIYAFQKVAAPNDHLLIAGSGGNTAYASKIKMLASQDRRIILHNQYIVTEQVQYYYGAADVVVLPFKNIEHSGSVDLAMSFAKTVITLKTNLLEERLISQLQLLFNKPEELAEKLADAKQLDIESIGKTNFQQADSVNYKDLLSFFDI